MLTAVYNIENTAKRFGAVAEMLERLQRGNKVQVDEGTMFGNINSAFIDLFQSFQMLDRISDKSKLANMRMVKDMTEMMYEQYKILRENTERPLTDYIQVFSRMKSLVESFDSGSLKYFSAYSLNEKNFNHWSNGTVAISNEGLSKAFKAIHFSGPFNMVDINCAYGEELLEFKKATPQANIYAISPYNSSKLDREDGALFNRFLLGGLKGIKSDNAAFDVAVITPTISVTRYEDEVFLPEEKVCFDRGFSWLRRGGIMIYVIPDFCITKSVATFLAKNLENIHVFRDPVLTDHNTVIIVGRKKESIFRDLDAEAFARLRNIFLKPELVEEPQADTYTLPKSPISIQKFRGGVLDDAQMAILMESSVAMRDFWKEQKVEKLSENSAHPLLPFNVGQLGLVLTSGCLDGIIEEPNNCSHVVKGRVIKRVDTDREFNEDGTRVQVSSTTSNRVEISMFLPDGTFKCLV